MNLLLTVNKITLQIRGKKQERMSIKYITKETENNETRLSNKDEKFNLEEINESTAKISLTEWNICHLKHSLVGVDVNLTLEPLL